MQVVTAQGPKAALLDASIFSWTHQATHCLGHCTHLRECRRGDFSVALPLIELRCDDVTAKKCEDAVLPHRLWEARALHGDFLNIILSIRHASLASTAHLDRSGICYVERLLDMWES